MYYLVVLIIIFDKEMKIQKYKFMLFVGIAGGTGSGKN
jgi:hypothetical protein